MASLTLSRLSVLDLAHVICIMTTVSNLSPCLHLSYDLLSFQIYHYLITDWGDDSELNDLYP